MAKPLDLESPAEAKPADRPLVTPAPRRLELRWSSLAPVLLPAFVVAAFLAIWQWVPPALGVPTYEIPNLSTTIQGLHDDWADIGNALLVTIQDALAGFILGNLLAILGATIFSYSRSVEQAFFPLAILVQTVPIIVTTPILYFVFNQIPLTRDNSQAIAVVCVAILITFFPTLVNMSIGFKSIDPRVYELMQLLNASRTQIFIKLRFPSALPYLFASLKITSTLAFVGAIVGEWMVSSGINPVGQALGDIGIQSLFGFPTNPLQATGVGGQLNIFYFRLDKPGLFAAVFAVSILSMLFFGLMVLLERLLVPWRNQQ